MKELDVTSLSERGMKLGQQIYQGVRDTQRVLITTLPDVLVITQDQFNSIKKDPDLMSSNNQEFLYRTPMNVMEVRVK